MKNYQYLTILGFLAVIAAELRDSTLLSWAGFFLVGWGTWILIKGQDDKQD